jgi:hypothetical protein
MQTEIDGSREQQQALTKTQVKSEQPHKLGKHSGGREVCESFARTHDRAFMLLIMRNNIGVGLVIARTNHPVRLMAKLGTTLVRCVSLHP